MSSPTFISFGKSPVSVRCHNFLVHDARSKFEMFSPEFIDAWTLNVFPTFDGFSYLFCYGNWFLIPIGVISFIFLL